MTYRGHSEPNDFQNELEGNIPRADSESNNPFDRRTTENVIGCSECTGEQVVASINSDSVTPEVTVHCERCRKEQNIPLEDR